MKNKKKENDVMQRLTDKKVLDLLQTDVHKVKPDIFSMLLQQARLGMLYQRDKDLSKRLKTSHAIRVITLVAQDTPQRREMIDYFAPEYSYPRQLTTQ